MSRRHLEIDLLRSLAVVLMIGYHAAYDAEYFLDIPVLTRIGVWDLVWARGTLTLFLLIVGTSFSISWERSNHRYTKYLVRGLEVLGCAMLITLVTYFVDPASYVRFGVLHMIAVSILLLPLCTPLRAWSGVAALAMLLSPFFFALPASPVGLFPSSFETVDYVPMIPWFGIVLLGYAAGDVLYNRMQFSFSWKHERALRILGAPGRYALIIYLLHQPVLFGAAFLPKFL